MSYWHYQLRRGRLQIRRLVRALSLSQRFLLVAVLVVAAAMAGLGTWSGDVLRSGITQGIAQTASDSIGPLIAHQLQGVSPDRPLSAADRSQLDNVFEIGSDADSTRLLQIRIFGSDGTMMFASPGDIGSGPGAADFARAAKGRLVARVVEAAIEAIGPVNSHPISVLEIITPLQRPGTSEVFAVADLTYSGKALLTIVREAQQTMWLIVGLIGIAITAVLYVLVDRSSRTIASQRARLARNLAVSRNLARENRSLHATSEQLRINAILANEYLLVRLGSDIHDGPVQLLALLILKLTKLKRTKRGPGMPPLEDAIGLGTRTIEELRTISAGLVLPELASQELEAAILLAISRHEALTGTRVGRRFAIHGAEASADVKVCAYRVVQEALSNAYRHGDGTEQAVTAGVSGRALTITVTNTVSTGRDDGPATDGQSTRQLGLRGMRFRVEALGGSLDSELDGTSARITVSIPLAGDASVPYPTSPEPTPE